MTELLVILAVLAAVVVVVGVANRRTQARELERRTAELEPVKKLAYEDITALGTELQALDAEVSGVTLDEGARADYQRALDAYEDAKVSGDSMTEPDDIKHVTGILDDGRYAIACVRARVAGEPLPTRRPPCFFDPRHGPSVADVDYVPSGGAPRSVPACALDAERVRVGADPDVRTVMTGSRRVPYWQGGPAYAPYAAGYFAAGAGMSLLFGGLLIGSMGGWGFGDGWGDHGGGDAAGDSGGDSGGDAGGDYGDGGDAGGDYGDGGGAGGDVGGGDMGGGDMGGGDMGGFGDFGGGF